MAAQDQTQAQAQPQSHPARDTALAAVGLTLLPTPVAPAALTVTAIATMTTALMTALRRFQNQRETGFQSELRTEALAGHPNIGDVVDSLIGRELGFEATFRAKQVDRVQAALGPALSEPDKDKRDAKVKAIFEAERRYTQQREAAMRTRVLAAVQHYELEQASPDGAFWMLGHGVAHHTPDCVAMSGHFWPWSVLHSFQPPVHHGCACYLLSENDAKATGMMSSWDKLHPEAANALAAERLRSAAKLMREGVTEQDVEIMLVEEAWDERWPKGTEFAGRFKPKVGGDPGAKLLARLKARHQSTHSDVTPGIWTHLGGKYVRVPRDEEWRSQVGGVHFHSPAGTTNVFRDGALTSLPQNPDDSSKINSFADALRDGRRKRYVDRPGMPLRAGDGPEAVGAMPEKGWDMTSVKPAKRGWTVGFQHRGTSMTATADVSRDGVHSAQWDPSPIAGTGSHAATTHPNDFGEHAKDVMAWGSELAERYGVGLKLSSVKQSKRLADHAGFHEFGGDVQLGREVAPDIERAARARRAGRDLTEDEKRGVYSSMWTSAHEMGHGLNPLSARMAHGEHASLEEALTEEEAHRLARERLGSQGQGDVVDWANRNPDALAVRGAYRRERGALADVMDAAGVKGATQRAQMIETLKYHTAPGKRMSVLGDLVAKQQGISKRDGEHAVRARLKNGGTARAVGMALPGTDKSGWKTLNGQGYKPKPSLDPKAFGATPGHAKWKEPAVQIGGVGAAPDHQGPIPSFSHIPMTLGRKGRIKNSLDATDDSDGDWTVQSHHGNENHVASELLANSVYRELGINVPTMGTVSTEASPDFASIPDQLPNEPAMPATGRMSTGIILRHPDGGVTVIEPRNHYGGYVHTFPKGGVEEGLTPQQNAHKELWEETGLHAHITGIVGDFKGDTGTTRYYEGVPTGGEVTPSRETAAIKHVSLKDAATMLNRDRDQDVLAELSKRGIPAGSFDDSHFPDEVAGVGLAYQTPEGKAFQPKTPSKALGAGYMADALLGNHAFLGDRGENVRYQGDDAPPLRVNHSGTFEYTPSGHHKDFTGTPDDVWHMLYKGDAPGAVDVDDKRMRAQARTIARKLTGDKLDELVNAAPFSDEGMRERVRGALKSRVEWMRGYGAGEHDLPELPSGAEAQALHAEAQSRFDLYPEEDHAITDYMGDKGDAAVKFLQAGAKSAPDDDTRRIVKHIDNVLNDAKTNADTLAFVPLTKAMDSPAGNTLTQKRYLTATTDRPAAANMIRLLVPGGSHALYRPGEEHDLLLPRNARLKFTRTSQENGQTIHDAILMPYSKPWGLQSSNKPKGLFGKASFALPPKPQGPKGDFAQGDAAKVNGVTGTITHVHSNGDVTFKMDGKNGVYRVPGNVPTKLSESGELHTELHTPWIAALAEAEQQNTGAMVALYPRDRLAKKLALPGGEPQKELHVTMAFLGKAADIKDHDKLKAAVADWASKTPAMDGEISGHGLFTAGDTPVTYISPDLPELPAARQGLVDAVEPIAPALKNHGYTPHMTLDYADRTKDLTDHGGRKLRFTHASLVLGDERHDFKLTGGKGS